MGPYQHFGMGGELQDVRIPLAPTSEIMIPSRTSLRSSKEKESLWTSTTIDANWCHSFHIT